MAWCADAFFSCLCTCVGLWGAPKLSTNYSLHGGMRVVEPGSNFKNPYGALVWLGWESGSWSHRQQRGAMVGRVDEIVQAVLSAPRSCSAVRMWLSHAMPASIDSAGTICSVKAPEKMHACVSTVGGTAC